jgi:hypothetical protein
MSRISLDFAETLASLGLDQYYVVLIRNGFGSWESVQRITETDMERLRIKCGSRRKLLRAIATNKGYPMSQALIHSKDSSATPSALTDPTTGQDLHSLEHISPTSPQGECSVSAKCSNPVCSKYNLTLTDSTSQ